MAKKDIKNDSETILNGQRSMFGGVKDGNKQNESLEADAVRVIDDEWVADRMQDFRKYREGKQWLEQSIIENEEWWKLHHWKYIPRNESNKFDPETKSAWLFNSLANKHADIMDNYPTAAVLPREQSDEGDAQRLAEIIPCILEYNGFERTYNIASWTKLKQGTSVYGVFWDVDAENGMGDIAVKQIDLLNIYWQPGIKDIQDSKYVFVTKRVDNDDIISMYPELKDVVGDAIAGIVPDYDRDDQVDRTTETVVFDCYYKTRYGSKTTLQYAKFACGRLLYASENDTEKGMETLVDPATMQSVTLPVKPSVAETGWYEHGKYPFVFDGLFPVEDSIVSMGYIHLMRDDQMYIDKLNQLIMKASVMAITPRWFKRRKGVINVDDFADWSKPFIDVEGSSALDEDLKQVQLNSIPNFAVNHLQMKIDELKETSGNRDFSQGSTATGVTSGTAIAALQEAGSKLSRSVIKGSYRAFQDVCYIVLELIRQFYDEERCFRIDGKNGSEFVRFSNSGIKPKSQINPFNGIEETRRPVFDIRISAEKKSPFSRVAQNETAKELYSMGFFNPQMAEQALSALDMMDFENIDDVRMNIQQNNIMYNAFTQLSQLAMKDALIVDEMTGGADPNTGMGVASSQIQAVLAQVSGEAPVMAGSYSAKLTGADGMPATDNTQATKARIESGKRSQVR